jgi:hypothetical protein
MISLRHSTCLILTFTSLALACSDDDPAAAAPDAGSAVRETPPENHAAERCKRDALESDLAYMPLTGPAVRDGAIEPGEYLMATTYLRLRADQSAVFQELVGPVIADISTRSGLVALTTASSSECGTARTLTVWRDEVAMLEFVVGEAHAKAMGSIHDISRGGSVAAQWTGDESTATWDAAAQHLATTDRAEY